MCGEFTHHNESGRVGCLYANTQCENFAWAYPNDKRPDYQKELPVFLIGNWYCGMCFVFEYVLPESICEEMSANGRQEEGLSGRVDVYGW